MKIGRRLVLCTYIESVAWLEGLEQCCWFFSGPRTIVVARDKLKRCAIEQMNGTAKACIESLEFNQCDKPSVPRNVVVSLSNILKIWNP